MGEVTKVRLTVNYEIGGHVWFKGDILYVSRPIRMMGLDEIILKSRVFESGGLPIGQIDGILSDYDDKKIFEIVETAE